MSSETESLYLLIYETKPTPELPNPNGWIGAVINCFIHTDSWENAEQLARATVEQEAWQIVHEVNRAIIDRSSMQEEGLPYFDHALQHGVSIQVNAWDEEEPQSPAAGEPASSEDPLTEAMVYSAEMAVKMGADAGYQFDYSEASLQSVDEMIAVYHPNGAALDTTYQFYTGYVGEVLRRNMGGEWRQTEENGLFFEGPNFQAGPLKWVRDKFQDPANYSLAAKYNALKQLTQETPPGLSNTPPPLPVGTPPPLPQTERTENKSIYQAPLIVFMLVAAADGDIDAKEAKKFKQIVQKVGSHPNKLFMASVSAMSVDFDQNVMELIEAGPLGMLALLTQARETAEAIAPEMAPGYAQALYELGQQVAKSSGGFFGLGGVGKTEKAALDLVAVTLGLPPSS